MEPILGGIASGNSSQGQACREGSETIIRRRMSENNGRAELYSWLLGAMGRNPMSKECEEALWSMLIRERPY